MGSIRRDFGWRLGEHPPSFCFYFCIIRFLFKERALCACLEKRYLRPSTGRKTQLAGRCTCWLSRYPVRRHGEVSLPGALRVTTRQNLIISTNPKKGGLCLFGPRCSARAPFLYVKSSISTECVEICLAVKNREDSRQKGQCREEEGKLNAYE